MSWGYGPRSGTDIHTLTHRTFRNTSKACGCSFVIRSSHCPHHPASTSQSPAAYDLQYYGRYISLYNELTWHTTTQKHTSSDHALRYFTFLHMLIRMVFGIRTKCVTSPYLKWHYITHNIFPYTMLSHVVRHCFTCITTCHGTSSCIAQSTCRLTYTHSWMNAHTLSVKEWHNTMQNYVHV